MNPPKLSQSSSHCAHEPLPVPLGSANSALTPNPRALLASDGGPAITRLSSRRGRYGGTLVAGTRFFGELRPMRRGNQEHSVLRGHSNRLKMLRAWAEHDAEVYQAFTTTVSPLLAKPLKSLRVLDIGCGPNAPMTVLLHAAGCRVTGVDATLSPRWGLGFRPGRYAEYVRTAGLFRTARKVLGELSYDRTYFNRLAEVTGLPISDNGLDLRTMDVQTLALPPESVDLIHSNATWEHIADVKAANATVARALVPGGVAYIEIHLFPSLSGGHDLPWIVPGTTVLGDVKPWRHLTDPTWKAPVFLNRHRERDYRRMFEETADLVIEDWKTEYTEGQTLLTPAVLQALPDYTPEELTKRSIIVVVRRIVRTNRVNSHYREVPDVPPLHPPGRSRSGDPHDRLLAARTPAVAHSPTPNVVSPRDTIPSLTAPAASVPICSWRRSTERSDDKSIRREGRFARGNVVPSDGSAVRCQSARTARGSRLTALNRRARARGRLKPAPRLRHRPTCEVGARTAVESARPSALHAYAVRPRATRLRCACLESLAVVPLGARRVERARPATARVAAVDLHDHGGVLIEELGAPRGTKR